MSKVTLEKQLNFETANKTGVAGKLNSLIADQAKVNIKAEWAGVIDGKGFFGFITSDNQRVKDALQGSDFTKFEEQDMLVVRVPDQAGACAEITNKIAKAGVNIQCFYTTVFDNHPAVVLSTEDNQKAFALFQ